MEIRDRVLRLERLPASSILPDPRNAKIHGDDQRSAIRAAFKEIGFAGVILAREREEDGQLVACDGHGRQEEAGDAIVPVVVLDLTEQEAAKFLLTYDEIGRMATTDKERIRELSEVAGRAEEDSLSRVILDLAERAEVDVAWRDDVIPPEPAKEDPGTDVGKPDELRAKYGTAAGQLWILGQQRLFCGDSTSAADVEKLLDGGKPRILDSDPPFGVQLDPTWRDGVFNKMGPGALPYMTEGHANRTISGDTIVDWSPAFELVPSLEIAYVWHAGVHAEEVARGLQRIGFQIRSQIIWVKDFPVIGRGDYFWQHEPCWYAVRKGCTANVQGDRLSTCWMLSSPKSIMSKSDEEKWDHPAQKPLECMRRPIQKHEGDVYEPFCGSGTTLIAAELEKRRCYGMEIDPKFVAIILERWAVTTGLTPTLAG